MTNPPVCLFVFARSKVELYVEHVYACLSVAAVSCACAFQPVALMKAAYSIMRAVVR